MIRLAGIIEMDIFGLAGFHGEAGQRAIVALYNPRVFVGNGLVDVKIG